MHYRLLRSIATVGTGGLSESVAISVSSASSCAVADGRPTVGRRGRGGCASAAMARACRASFPAVRSRRARATRAEFGEPAIVAKAVPQLLAGCPGLRVLGIVIDHATEQGTPRFTRFASVQ